MPRTTIFPNLILCLFLTLLGSSLQAEQADIKPFISGSYQQILANNANHPFMLVVWSIDCPSCLKDMALLSSIHKNKPELKMIMLAADDLSATDQIQQLLKKNQLSDIENWVFADENTQKLRFEIDPKWYGEMPRTYFLDAAHQRKGVSGVLTNDDYEAMFNQILN